MLLSVRQLLSSTRPSLSTRSASQSQVVRNYASLSAIHDGVRRSERFGSQGSRSKGDSPFKSAGGGGISPYRRKRLEKESMRARDKDFDDFAKKFSPSKGRQDESSGYGRRDSRGPRESRPARDRFARDSGRVQERSFQRERPDRGGMERSWEKRGRSFQSERPDRKPRDESDRGERAFRSERHDRSSRDMPDSGVERSFRSDRSDRRPREFSDRHQERSGRDAERDRASGGRSWEGPDSDRAKPSRFGDRMAKREAKKDWPPHLDRPRTDSRQQPEEEQAPASFPYTTAASQFLYGKSQVEAALRAARRKLYKLYVYGGANRMNIERDVMVDRLAQSRGVEVVIEKSLARMDKMSEKRPHNGYILEASPLPQLPITALGPVSQEGGKPGFHVAIAYQSAEEAQINGTSDFVPITGQTHKPFVVVLDQILDPGNLGATLRSVSFLGVNAVVITKRSSAHLTPVALKASSGAAESLTIFSVESMVDFLNETREKDWKIFAAAPAATSSPSLQRRHLDMHEVEDANPLSEDPCVLLVGNEGEGLSKQLRSKADYEVSIPNLSGSTFVDSLNVSVATALLSSAFLKGPMRAVSQQFGEQKADSEDALF